MDDFSSGPRRRSRPIRRSVEYEQSEGDGGLEPVRVEQWDFSAEGSIDHRSAVRPTFYETCGCTTAAPLGGRCGICGLTACGRHFLTCSRCGLGICSLDTRMIESRDLVAPYCLDCAEATAPVRAISNVVRFLGFGR